MPVSEQLFEIRRKEDGDIASGLSLAQVHALVKAGKARPEDEIRKVGRTTWHPLGGVKGLEFPTSSGSQPGGEAPAPLEAAPIVSHVDADADLTPLLDAYEAGIEEAHDALVEFIEEVAAEKRKKMWLVLGAVAAAVGAAALFKSSRQPKFPSSEMMYGVGPGMQYAAGVSAAEAASKRLLAGAGAVALGGGAVAATALGAFNSAKGEETKLSVLDQASLLVGMLDEFFGAAAALIPYSSPGVRHRCFVMAAKYGDVLCDLTESYSSRFGVNLTAWMDAQACSPERLISLSWISNDEEVEEHAEAIARTWCRFDYMGGRESRVQAGAPRGLFDLVAFRAGSVLGWPRRVNQSSMMGAVASWFGKSAQAAGVDSEVEEPGEADVAGRSSGAVRPLLVSWFLILIGIGGAAVLGIGGAALSLQGTVLNVLIGVAIFLIAIGFFAVLFMTPRCLSKLGQREFVPIYWVAIVIGFVAGFGVVGILLSMFLSIVAIRNAKKWASGEEHAECAAEWVRDTFDSLRKLPEAQVQDLWMSSVATPLAVEKTASSRPRGRGKRAGGRD